MDLLLNKSVIFVTGGSKGIGQAVVLQLLNEGARVSTCARGKKGLEELFEQIPEHQKNNLMVQSCDVCDAEQMAKAILDTVSKFGQIDGIVANAGSGTSGTILDTSNQDWLSQYKMKMLSIINLIKSALPELEKSNSPRIVIMNGITANVPDPDMAAVSAARAAVKQSAQLYASAFAPNICVNTVNIGVVDTGRQVARYRKSNTELSYEEWRVSEAKRRGIPMGRLGKPNEVAPIVCFLLSPLCSYITGSSIDVSGGLHAR